MEYVVLINLASRIRSSKLNGKDYLVAPLTLIVPGVLNGSKGPLLYAAEEVQKTVKAWNGMPLSLGHPTGSARNPVVLDAKGLGYVFNVAFRSNRLVGEGWFDVEACRRIDDRVLALLKDHQKIELSTGLDAEAVPAVENSTHNGKPYTHIVRNFKPDHVAILLDEKGACSNEDGCGVNNKACDQKKGLWRKLGELLGVVSPEAEAISNTDIDFASKVGMDLEPLTEEMRAILHAQMVKESQSVVNQETSQGDIAMRDQVVNWLVTNCDCWKGKDKVLQNKDAFSDEDLNKFKAAAEKSKENEILVANYRQPAPEREAAATATVQNQDQPRLTAEEQEDLLFARQEKQRRKDAMISKLVRNVEESKKAAHVAVLNKKSIAELEMELERLPPQAQAHNGPPHERHDSVSARFGLEPVKTLPVRNAKKDEADVEEMDTEFTLNYAQSSKEDAEEMAV